jgi:hypothetical protein
MGAQQSKCFSHTKRCHVVPVDSQFKPVARPSNKYFDKLQEELMNKKIGYLKGTKIKPIQNIQKGLDRKATSNTVRFSNLARPDSNFSCETLDVQQRNTYENKTSVSSDTKSFKLLNKTLEHNHNKSPSFDEKVEKFSQKQTFFEPIRIPDQYGTETIVKSALHEKRMNPYMFKNLNRQATLIKRQKEFNLEKSIPSEDITPNYKHVLVSEDKLVELPVLFKFQLKCNQVFKPTTIDQLPVESMQFSRLKSILTYANKTSLINRQDSMIKKFQTSSKHGSYK